MLSRFVLYKCDNFCFQMCLGNCYPHFFYDFMNLFLIELLSYFSINFVISYSDTTIEKKRTGTSIRFAACKKLSFLLLLFMRACTLHKFCFFITI